MAISLWFAHGELSVGAGVGTLYEAAFLAGLVVFGLFVFAAAAIGCGAARPSDIRQLLDRSTR